MQAGAYLAHCAAVNGVQPGRRRVQRVHAVALVESSRKSMQLLLRLLPDQATPAQRISRLHHGACHARR